ncbi:MAG TPA: Type 1 glutamine amidotransferase-like domain-containing protein [Anaerolineales bacterium]|nr:Type 1 glutamine amidotransferase-like domain-containing protein [Anaerolineales bacterium]
MGYLLLEGGAEFGGLMREPDLRAIELAGGLDVPIRIIPTAAAPDNNHQRAGNNGIHWFQGLGARDVESVPLIDKPSADDPKIIESLRHAKLIYMLGGFTGYLGETLAGSAAWEAVLEAYRAGGVVAGSSAGAMVMCEFYYDPSRGQIVDGLNLVEDSLVLPHHDTFGKSWAGRLLEISQVALIGIDEQTGILDDGSRKTWSVLGRGSVTIYRYGQEEAHPTGSSFSL